MDKGRLAIVKERNGVDSAGNPSGNSAKLYSDDMRSFKWVAAGTSLIVLRTSGTRYIQVLTPEHTIGTMDKSDLAIL